MNLASHFVPFLKSAPPKAIKTLGLGVVVALVAVGPAGAVTVDREKVAEGGHRFEVRCQSPAGWVTAKPSEGRASIVQREPVRDRALVSKRMPATIM